MADSFPMFDLNKPVSEDDDGHVEFDLNDPEDDDDDAAFDLNDPPLEHGNGITSSLVHVLCYLFLSIVSHIIASYFDRS